VEEFLGRVALALLFAFYCILLPPILLLATPFILLWPGKRLGQGRRGPKDIKKRYKRILTIWVSVGASFPT
jgi:hypothetical protein